MASESCSTSSYRHLATILFPFFLLHRKVTPSKLRQEAEYNTVDETDTAAAEVQSGESESHPNLDLWPHALRVGKTFWCQCGECFARDRRQDCVCCFDYVKGVEKVHSASTDCT